MEYKENSVYQGFKVIENRYIKVINSECILFEHEKTKAQLLCLSNDDKNKVFGIGFRTPPKDNTGVTHIIEHSVLCGSKKYPLNEPFVELLKSSLQTYVNAATYPDKTIYPVASMNDKDFQNLMSVYLDAVFNPMIHEKDEIMMQEGWHYELFDSKDDIEYKGVVYNEMKGDLSSPESLFFSKSLKTLFPDNVYFYEYGGEPKEIPELTLEEFREYHKKYYHPSNSYIYLYGNMNIDEKLKYINEEYLNKYEYKDVDSKIYKQETFKNEKELDFKYPAIKNDNNNEKNYYSFNFVCGDATDLELKYAINILSRALMSNASDPLKSALIKSNIAKDYIMDSGGDPLIQLVTGIYAFEAKEGKKEEFKNIILDTLKGIVEKGINVDRIESIINRLEFNVREANTGYMPKGLLFYTDALKAWLYDSSPIDVLDMLKPLENIKKQYKNGYFEKLIKECYLDNNHRSLVMMEPDDTLLEKQEDEIKDKLKVIKENMSNDEIDNVVLQNEKLKERQEYVANEEDLEVLPRLKIEEIDKETEFFKLQEENINGVKTYVFKDFSNEIIYTDFMFNACTIKKELLPFISIFNNLLAEVDTKKYNLSELTIEIGKNLGGFAVNSRLIQNKDFTGEYISQIIIKVKGLEKNKDKIFDILKEIMFNSNITDEVRIKEILEQLVGKLRSALNNNAIVVAANSISNGMTEASQYIEETTGVKCYKFLKNLYENFEENIDFIKESLMEIYTTLFNKNNLEILVTCDEKNYDDFKNNIKEFVELLSDGQVKLYDYSFDLSQKNIGYEISSQVQYVAKGYNLKKLGYKLDDKLFVLRQILVYDYLWTNVRVKGGAYGCNLMNIKNGDFIVASYRDPNLKKTLNVYNDMYKYVENLDLSKNELDKYIISTIGLFNNVFNTSKEKADYVYINMKKGIDKTYLQDRRNNILNTTLEDLRGFSKMIKDIMEEDCISVAAAPKKIKENEELFNSIEKID